MRAARGALRRVSKKSWSPVDAPASSARAAHRATVQADGGYHGTGLLIPHRRRLGQTDLPAWKERDNTDHRRVRARVEHTFAAMKTWKILRDCRRRGHGVYWATSGVAHVRNLALFG